MKKLLTILLLLPSLAFSMKTINLTESNTINFNSKFTNGFVAKKQKEAIGKCLKNPNSEINVVLYTPGGSVSAGQLFFDTLKALPCKFNTITIFAASMGFSTVQSLGNRYILPSGILMAHRASVSGIGGELGGELDSLMSLLKDNVTSLEIDAAKRIGIDLKTYRELIRDELWLTSSKAVKGNYADEVVLASCDNSLLGTYTERVDGFFGSFEVTFSKCPLITGVLGVRALSRDSNYVLLNKYYNNIQKYTATEL